MIDMEMREKYLIERREIDAHATDSLERSATTVDQNPGLAAKRQHVSTRDPALGRERSPTAEHGKGKW